MAEKIRGKFLILKFAIVGVVIAGAIFDHYSHSESYYDHVLTVAAFIESMKLPRMIDSNVRLDAVVSGPNRNLEYRYTLVNRSAADIATDRFTDQMRPKLVARYKTDQRLKNFRDEGVTFINRYSDRKGVLIAEIVVEPKDLQ
jgi:hypothetical protein